MYKVTSGIKKRIQTYGDNTLDVALVVGGTLRCLSYIRLLGEIK